MRLKCELLNKAILRVPRPIGNGGKRWNEKEQDPIEMIPGFVAFKALCTHTNHKSSKQLNSKLSLGCLACNLQKEPCDISEYWLAANSKWNSEKLVTSPSSRWFGLEVSFLLREGDVIQGCPNFTHQKWNLKQVFWCLTKPIALCKWIVCFDKVVNWFW